MAMIAAWTRLGHTANQISERCAANIASLLRRWRVEIASLAIGTPLT
jgi:hypothetical protein